jgi:hypothetical protein
VAPSGQGQAPKKIPETDAIFENIREQDGAAGEFAGVKRLSRDGKATVNIGDYSRGSQSRGDHRAGDHDLGCQEKYIPGGIVEEDTGQLHITFGSSYKTSDFMVDTLGGWWEQLGAEQQQGIDLMQLKIDNGPGPAGFAPNS